ncbi:MAG TPA: NAD(P)/FAD-dependent oxidoreductase [Gemmatimonadota bacterium]|nr:NAD(P)/FAD-dependent oxidoreductase [Gemmatimonadota bacterium]
MSARPDVLVLGSGLEELVAAARLAGAGRRVVVLEPGEAVGGPAAGEELLPGFRVDPVFADAGFLDPRVLRDLELERHGLGLLAPDPVLAAPGEDGAPILLWRDPGRTRATIAARSAQDAGRWPEFAARMESFARVLEEVCARPAFRPAGPLRELAPLLGIGRRVRGLGRERMVDLLRTLPLPARDLLDDVFEDDRLKGALGALAVRGVFQGPRSPGTALVFLHHHVGSPAGVFGLRTVVRGGVDALAAALAEAARSRGAEIRVGTPVSRIAVEGGRATGVVLEGGEEIPARAVLSGADPARTLLDLAGATWLDPDFVHAVRQIRFRGGHARVHLALSEAPRFEGLEDGAAGLIVIARDLDAVERAYDDAKHGGMAARPVLEARVPSLADPSLAPAGRHVMSIDARFVPPANGMSLAEGDREALGDRVVEILAEGAPNLSAAILGRRVLLPADLATRYDLTGGDPFQGELALDQLLFLRPVPGWARHATPIPGLWLCGPGTHPAGAITGASGGHAAAAVHADLEGGS